MDLFEHARRDDLAGIPLAERMRPETLDEVVGQPQLCAEGTMLRRAAEARRIPSILLWGPPGSGKTTLAEVLSKTTDARFARMSAVSAGAKDIRAEIEGARRGRMEGRRTVLFLDEIHRFNKAQQDLLLPHVETGLITLIGATTENPSFEVNAALLSRCRVLVTKGLDSDALATLIDRALRTPKRGLGELGLSLDEDARRTLQSAAGGDARRLLGALEVAADLAVGKGRAHIQLDDAEAAVTRRVVLFDKKGDAHYGVVSAFIKSMRGSDPDAAIYYLARMLEAGEDPRFILRRLVIFASEDVGAADPAALMVATAALSAFELIGMPEGMYPLAQATLHLASAPKSNSAGAAFGRAKEAVLRDPAAEVPAHLIQADTPLMKAQGLGAGYQYPHDHAGHFVAETYLPAARGSERYYEPTTSGAERRVVERLAALWPGRRFRPDEHDR